MTTGNRRTLDLYKEARNTKIFMQMLLCICGMCELETVANKLTISTLMDVSVVLFKVPPRGQKTVNAGLKKIQVMVQF